MKNNASLYFLVLIASFAILHTGMADKSQYDQAARAQEAQEKALKKSSSNVQDVRGGLRDATVGSTSELVSETVRATRDEPPILGTLEGARVGGSKAVTTAAKGVLEVATLGYGDSETFEVEQPRSDSDDVTKFKIGF